MWRTTLKSIGAHKRRLLATCSAVVLGVAFLAGTLVLGDTVSAGFDDLFVEANAGTDAIVRSSTEVGEGDFTERGMIEERGRTRFGAVTYGTTPMFEKLFGLAGLDALRAEAALLHHAS